MIFSSNRDIIAGEEKVTWANCWLFIHPWQLNTVIFAEIITFNKQFTRKTAFKIYNLGHFSLCNLQFLPYSSTKHMILLRCHSIPPSKWQLSPILARYQKFSWARKSCGNSCEYLIIFFWWGCRKTVPFSTRNGGSFHTFWRQILNRDISTMRGEFRLLMPLYLPL